MIYILDSSAMVAFLNGETGADVVERILTDKSNDCFAHAINLCEFYYDAIRAVDEKYAQASLTALSAANVVERNDFDTDFWKEVARLKATHKASLADFCGIVLTNKLGGTFLTADHHELDKLAANKVCSIEFIR